jgi:hypothetical protein
MKPVLPQEQQSSSFETERRRHPRLSLEIPCQCEWHGQAINARSVNVALGGALVRHPIISPPDGSYVTVTFYAGKPVVLEASVVRHEEADGKQEFSVSFYGGNWEHQEKLEPVFQLYNEGERDWVRYSDHYLESFI